MKKFLLCLIFTAFFFGSHAQYYKMLGSSTSDWYIFDAFIPVSQSQKFSSPNAPPPVTRGKYTAKTDTVLFTKNYKKFYQIYQMPSFPLNNHIGYLREDTINRKVYFMDKTTFVEDLIYDFSMVTGDSIYMNFPSTSPPFPKGFYKVKAIQNITIKAGVRKMFKLKLSSGISDTLKVIESLGSEIHPVFMYNWYFAPGQFLWGMGPCKYPYALGVACKYSNNIKEFQSCTYQLALGNGCIFKSDSCNYWNTCSGINELGIIKNITVSPNPAITKCTIVIELGENTSAAIELYDISGRKIRNISNERLEIGTSEITFDISDLLNGLYFIKTKSENFELNYPLIIQH